MLIPIAKILTTHGIKGEVKVSPLTFNFELLFRIKKFYLSKNKTDLLEVRSVRKGPGFEIILIKFKNVDFEKAKTLINQTLYVDLQDLPSLEEDEFYYHQILNFEVKDKKGNYWGKVKEIMPIGEYDLILVKKDKEEFYIPLVEEYVEEIDFQAGIILVKDIKDLVESQKI
ncbi:ribosome maturation factor RimM [Thermodesulfobacterium hydrogeniphilum]|uniref:ribosome maturation factor RimM n=1 Tax=Thermodesulfobacterium hydrogeniphilum TaxID=161156 RepID=UPI00056FE0A3|nr:ribosome maturation factor RimM [Thermodesulfobacterium hydrogeniphilum]